MRATFDLGLFLTFVLAIAGLAYVAASIVRTLWPRKKTARLRFAASRGAHHIIPGPGHTEAEDCDCHPRVDGLPGNLFIEHRETAPR